MAPKRETVLVKYSRPGTQPPIFLAGSFSKPEWQPQEMNHKINNNNEYEFTKEVDVEEAKEYQYKFRVGEGDWWVVDEDSTTATDAVGNRNNLLYVAVSDKDTEEAAAVQPPEKETAAEEALPETSVSSNEANSDYVAIHKQVDEGIAQEVASSPAPAVAAAALDDTKPERIDHRKENAELSGSDEVKELLEKVDPKQATKESSSVLEDPKVEGQNGQSNGAAGVSYFPPTPPEAISLTTDKRDDDEPTKSIGTSQLIDTPEDVSSSKSENGKDEPDLRSGDVSNADATVAHEDTYQTHAPDIGSDHDSTHDDDEDSQELADNAAEVADSAASLDRDQPTPPISDKEAGEIGFRRMSLTPIPQVADTAAEVADVAARLDKNHMTIEIPAYKSPSIIDCNEEPLLETPEDERAPRERRDCFPGCVPPPTKRELAIFAAQDAFYANDEPPSPSKSEPGTDEEIASDGETTKPGIVYDSTAEVQDVNSSPEEIGSTPAEPISNGKEEATPSVNLPQLELDDIANSKLDTRESGKSIDNPKPTFEEDTNEDTKKAELDHKKITIDLEDANLGPNFSTDELDDNTADKGVNGASLDNSHTVPSPTTPFVVGNRQLGHEDEQLQAISTGADGPNITVEPATPAASSNTTDPFSKPLDTAKAAEIEEDAGTSQLTSRKQQPSPSAERSLTPSSIGHVGKGGKGEGFLKAFWHVLFGWIGGLFTKLRGGRRPTLIAISAVAFATVAWYISL